MRIQKRVSKAHAREQFPELMESVANGMGAIEITDGGKVAAVILSKPEYDWLCACTRNAKPKRSPRGLMIFSDSAALDDASEKVRAEFEDSIKRLANEI